MRKDKNQNQHDINDSSGREKKHPGAADARPHKRKKRMSGDFSDSELNFSRRFVAPIICVLLFLAVFLVFGQSLGFKFINYDDNEYVYENSCVMQGLTPQGIVWAFTEKHSSNWHPLTWMSHMLDCQMYGLKPGGHHLTNVLLHAAVVITLFLMLKNLTGELWPSAFVAALFAVHPLRVESVAWVAERKDLISGLFFMLTLWAYCGYARKPNFSPGRYLLVILLFGLGLMAKPMLVSVPFILLLLDYWPLGRTGLSTIQDSGKSGNIERQEQLSVLRRLFLEKVPLFVLVAFSCAATLWAQSRAVASYDKLALHLRLGNAVVSYISYIIQIFYPFDLAVLYLHPGPKILPLKVAASVVLFLAFCGAVLIFRKRYPYLLTGWLWYVVMLLPVIGLVQVGLQEKADRYTYLPQIGLYIAVVWGVNQISRRWSHRSLVLGVSGTLALTVLIAIAYRQTSYWIDGETLWRHTLDSTTDNHVAYNNLGNVLRDAGKYQDAMKCYEHVLHMKVKFPEIYNSIGITMTKMSRYKEAVEYLEKAVKFPQNLPKAYSFLGVALLNSGKTEDAIENFLLAVQGDPDNADYHNNLGAVYKNTNRPEKAIEQFQQAILINDNSLEAHFNLASLYTKSEPAKAAVEARKALKLAKTQGNVEICKMLEKWLNSSQHKTADIPVKPLNSNKEP